MPKLSEILAQERRMREQKREIRELREELEKLRTKNERMREAMRRCLTCDYRLEVDGRR
jgi:septal ring factor EnvC (AmiA/AmiB activator)